MAKSVQSVQKRLREQRMAEKREEKARRRAARQEAKKLRAEAIARGEDPDALDQAKADPGSQEDVTASEQQTTA